MIIKVCPCNLTDECKVYKFSVMADALTGFPRALFKPTAFSREQWNQIGRAKSAGYLIERANAHEFEKSARSFIKDKTAARSGKSERFCGNYDVIGAGGYDFIHLRLHHTP